jgi:hypothetical protein
MASDWSPLHTALTAGLAALAVWVKIASMRYDRNMRALTLSGLKYSGEKGETPPADGLDGLPTFDKCDAHRWEHLFKGKTPGGREALLFEYEGGIKQKDGTMDYDVSLTVLLVAAPGLPSFRFAHDPDEADEELEEAEEPAEEAASAAEEAGDEEEPPSQIYAKPPEAASLLTPALRGLLLPKDEDGEEDYDKAFIVESNGRWLLVYDWWEMTSGPEDAPDLWRRAAHVADAFASALRGASHGAAPAAAPAAEPAKPAPEICCLSCGARMPQDAETAFCDQCGRNLKG